MQKLSDADVRKIIESHFEEEGLEVVCRRRRRAWCIYWAEDMEPLARLRRLKKDNKNEEDGDLFEPLWWDGNTWVRCAEDGMALSLESCLRFIIEDPTGVFGIVEEDEEDDEGPDIWGESGQGGLDDDYEPAAGLREDEDYDELEDDYGEAEEEIERADRFKSAATSTFTSILLFCAVLLAGIGAGANSLGSGLMWGSITSLLAASVLILCFYPPPIHKLSATVTVKVLAIAFVVVAVSLALLSFPGLIMGHVFHQAIGPSFWGILAGAVTAFCVVILSTHSKLVARFAGGFAGMFVAVRLADAFGWQRGVPFLLLATALALMAARVSALGSTTWLRVLSEYEDEDEDDDENEDEDEE